MIQKDTKMLIIIVQKRIKEFVKKKSHFNFFTLSNFRSISFDDVAQLAYSSLSLVSASKRKNNKANKESIQVITLKKIQNKIIRKRRILRKVPKVPNAGTEGLTEQFNPIQSGRVQNEPQDLAHSCRGKFPNPGM